MSSWRGKTRGGIVGYKIFVALIKYPGISFAYFLLRFVALYFFLFSGRSFKTIYSFYRNRMHHGRITSVMNVYSNYYAFGQVLLDRTAFMAGYRTGFSFDFDGEKYLHEMVDNRTGGLLISAHIGNFEMAGQMLERLHAKINIIMLDAEHEKIRDYLSAVIRKTFHVILVKKDASHIYEVKHALENKEIVCIHGDRFVEGSKKISCNFLGGDADFPSGPFYLAMKYDVPVSFVFAMKENKTHYHFYATRPKTYHQQTSQKKRDDTILEIIRDYVGEMEIMLSKYPLQWFNYYDFWKKETE